MFLHCCVLAVLMKALNNRVWLPFYLSLDPHSRPLTYFMCACTCAWVCTLTNLCVFKVPREKEEGRYSEGPGFFSGRLDLPCLLEIVLFFPCSMVIPSSSVTGFSSFQLLFLIPSLSTHLSPQPCMHVVLVCVPGWPQILIVLLFQLSMCWGCSHVLPCQVSHSGLIDWLIDWSEVLEIESRISPTVGRSPSTELLFEPF